MFREGGVLTLLKCFYIQCCNVRASAISDVVYPLLKFGIACIATWVCQMINFEVVPERPRSDGCINNLCLQSISDHRTHLSKVSCENHHFPSKEFITTHHAPARFINARNNSLVGHWSLITDAKGCHSDEFSSGIIGLNWRLKHFVVVIDRDLETEVGMQNELWKMINVL